MAKRITGEMLDNFNIKSNMENIEQENTQEVQQENSSQEQSVRVAQLVPPKEALERMKELERKYRETIERENK